MFARLRAHWQFKLLLTVVINLGFWAGYGWLGRSPVFPPWMPPQVWLDTAIPFQPEPWACVYLSQFLFTGGLPWLIDTRDGVRRYSVGLVAMSAVSFAVFLFWPVASPRPAGLIASGAMAVILGYDGAWNAFPSLHAGFLVYMARLAWRMFGGVAPVAVALVTAAWGVAILYATIATRQHYVVDLVAGAAIGATADWVAWSRGVPRRAAMTMERSRAVASHDGSK